MKDSTILDKKPVRLIIAVLFWLAVWQILSMLVGKELLLPSPYSTAHALFTLASSGSFWLSVIYSIIRVFCGLICGCLLGVILAAACAFSKLCSVIFTPVIRLMRTVPVASFIILALIWIYSGILPGFIAAIVVLPVVWENVSQGISQIDTNLIEVGTAYSFSISKKLKFIYIPSVKPYFKAACTMAVGMAWKAGVAAEVLCQPRGAIGTQLYYSKIYLETDKLFAWTAVTVILSFIVEKLIIRLIKDSKWWRYDRNK